jgi:hypothetical protein
MGDTVGVEGHDGDIAPVNGKGVGGGLFKAGVSWPHGQGLVLDLDQQWDAARNQGQDLGEGGDGVGAVCKRGPGKGGGSVIFDPAFAAGQAA